MKKFFYYVGLILFAPIFLASCVIIMVARLVLSFGYAMIGNWKQAKTLIKNLFQI